MKNSENISEGAAVADIFSNRAEATGRSRFEPILHGGRSPESISVRNSFKTKHNIDGISNFSKIVTRNSQRFANCRSAEEAERGLCRANAGLSLVSPLLVLSLEEPRNSLLAEHNFRENC